MTGVSESSIAGGVTSDLATPGTTTGGPFAGFRHQNRISAFDTAIVASVGLFTVLWIPLFVANTVPRMALAFGLMPIGLGLAVGAARRRDRAAVAMLACVVVVVVAGLFAEARTVAFVGQMPEWASVIALVASLAWWALGRGLTGGGRSVLAQSLAVGALLNGAVSIVQLLVGVRDGELFMFGARGSGLMVNPIFYGTVLAGVAALWTGLACEIGTRSRLSLCGLLAGLAALSGGRVVLLATIATWLGCLLLWRRKALLPLLANALGLAGAELFNRTAESSSSVERLGSGESLTSRLDVWRISLEAFLERPVFGWGPANAELAIMRGIDRQFVRDHWSDGNVITWWDPHNVLVFLLVSVGLVGTTAVVMFLVLAVKGKRDWPLLLGAAAMAFTWSLQPFTVQSLPITQLLLGASVRASPARPSAGDDVGEANSTTLGLRQFERNLFAFGALVTAVVLSAALVIDRSAARGEPDRAAAMAKVFAGDPWLELYLTDAYQHAYRSGRGDQELLSDGLAHARAAADLYPTSAHYQRVADAAVAAGDYVTARAALARAESLEPWDPFAQFRLLLIADHFGDDAVADTATKRLCDLGEYWCELAGLRYERPVEGSSTEVP